MSECKLRAANYQGLVRCDEEKCVFWRALEHLGTPEGEGCAIEYFELLANDGVAEWLLSVKERVENTAAMYPPLAENPTRDLDTYDPGAFGPAAS